MPTSTKTLTKDVISIKTSTIDFGFHHHLDHSYHTCNDFRVRVIPAGGAYFPNKSLYLWKVFWGYVTRKKVAAKSGSDSWKFLRLRTYMSARTARSPQGFESPGTWLCVRGDSQISSGAQSSGGAAWTVRSPQEIRLGSGEESLVFPRPGVPQGKMDSDFSGGGGGGPSLVWAIREVNYSVGHGVKEHNGNSGHCIQ
jgi:hypothetical protein